MQASPQRDTWQAGGRILLWLGVALAVAVPPLGADSGWARHARLFAVPALPGVQVDGSLDDWDLSGQVETFVVSETRATQSARFAVMYDAEALYLSALVRDPSPLMNRHDPRVDAHRGWDGDACQFRLVVDRKAPFPERESSFDYGGSSRVDTRNDIVHLTLWHYTDRHEACLQLHEGMTYRLSRPEWGPHGAVPAGSYRGAYARAEDGLGYVFEYRIPWATLDATDPPRAGDRVSGTVQFNWSTPDGLSTAGGSAWAYDVMSSQGFPYQTTACWGTIVFAPQGHLAHQLVDEGIAPERPLPLEFAYDLPEDGQVSIALADTGGRVVRTLVAQGPRLAGRVVEHWDGMDDQGQPLLPGRYAWRGLYHGPITTRFVLSVHNSGRPPYKTDDGTGGWGGDHGTPTAVCAAGQCMLLAWSACESGWGIIRVDLDGRKQWGSKHDADHLASDGSRLYIAGGHGFDQAPGVRVLSLEDARPLNWGSGAPQLLLPDAAPADTVTGLACGAGTVYVAYGSRDLVGLFNAASGEPAGRWSVPQPGPMAWAPDGSLAVVSGQRVLRLRAGRASTWTDHDVDAPSGVAVDSLGQLFVANRGARQDVTVFAADGHLVRTIGTHGGRPRLGRYRQNGMLEPGGIALDARGRLWVAETLDSPKRHSVWDSRTGAFAAEYFGGSAYFGWAWMDPERPDEVYCHNVLWKVDLDAGTCRPLSTIWRATAPNMVSEANPNGYAGHFRVLTARSGRQFGWGMREHANVLYMRDGDVYKPIAGAIHVQPHNPFLQWPPYPLFADTTRFPPGTYLWQDANDDQTLQEDEVRGTARDGSVFNWIDPQLSAWCDAGYVLRPRIAADGRPVYDFAAQEAVPFRGYNGNATSLWLSAGLDTVFTLNPGQDPGLAAWTRDGRLLWAYPHIAEWQNALSLPLVTPGKLWGLTMPLGCAGPFIGAATYFNPYHLFTADGLYVAMVMRDGRTGGLGADITASETITGQLVKPRGMDRYFLLAGDQDGRITEILGLQTVRRLSGGTYDLAPSQAQQALRAQQEYEGLQAKSRPLVIGRGRASLQAAAPVERRVDEQRSFAVRAAYDVDSLYLAFEVRTPHELANSEPDEHVLFRGGNLLDLQLATDPEADAQRQQPAPGDLRLLITRRGGQPLAVCYRPRVPGSTAAPVVLESPTGRESFDGIERVAGVGLEYAWTAGRGFTAVAAVPLDALGWRPQPGAGVRLDLGYVFGNAAGTQAAVRAYWANHGFAAGVTYDVPSEARLEPGRWGTAVVE